MEIAPKGDESLVKCPDGKSHSYLLDQKNLSVCQNPACRHAREFRPVVTPDGHSTMPAMSWEEAWGLRAALQLTSDAAGRKQWGQS